MATAPTSASPLADTDVFLRLWERHKLTKPLARHLLRMKFSANDRKRMHELAARNSGGTILRSEVRELDTYIRVGTLLSILQSRARQLLGPATAGRANGRE